jgi:hypothetical protein
MSVFERKADIPSEGGPDIGSRFPDHCLDARAKPERSAHAPWILFGISLLLLMA